MANIPIGNYQSFTVRIWAAQKMMRETQSTEAYMETRMEPRCLVRRASLRVSQDVLCIYRCALLLSALSFGVGCLAPSTTLSISNKGPPGCPLTLRNWLISARCTSGCQRCMSKTLPSSNDGWTAPCSYRVPCGSPPVTALAVGAQEHGVWVMSRCYCALVSSLDTVPTEVLVRAFFFFLGLHDAHEQHR